MSVGFQADYKLSDKKKHVHHEKRGFGLGSKMVVLRFTVKQIDGWPLSTTQFIEIQYEVQHWR